MSPLRVLAVEDEPAIRHIIDRVLTRRGHHVLTAPDASQAGLLLLDFPDPLDVGLIDIRLPGPLNGIELAAQLSRRIPAMRIIMTTG